MSETLLQPRRLAQAGSLLTPLSIVEGEALIYLERHGATPLRRLTRELEWPSPMIMMAVGALIREGLARAAQHELEVIVESVPQSPAPVAEMWSG